MIDYSSLPEHMQEGMRLYIERGIVPGSFLTAVLENNLIEAFGMADHINQAHMKEWCAFVYNELPGNCHGSPEIVSAWMAKFNQTEKTNGEKY